MTRDEWWRSAACAERLSKMTDEKSDPISSSPTDSARSAGWSCGHVPRCADAACSYNPAMQTLRVHLADAPTDVLVWLAGQPADRWWTPDGITERCAPADADHALRSTVGAINLLHVGGLIEGRSIDGFPMWRATDKGRSVVAEARNADS